MSKDQPGQQSMKTLPQVFISPSIKTTPENERREQILKLFEELFPNEGIKSIKTMSGGVTNLRKYAHWESSFHWMEGSTIARNFEKSLEENLDKVQSFLFFP